MMEGLKVKQQRWVGLKERIQKKVVPDGLRVYCERDRQFFQTGNKEVTWEIFIPICQPYSMASMACSTKPNPSKVIHLLAQLITYLVQTSSQAFCKASSSEPPKLTILNHLQFSQYFCGNALLSQLSGVLQRSTKIIARRGYVLQQKKERTDSRRSRIEPQDVKTRVALLDGEKVSQQFIISRVLQAG